MASRTTDPDREQHGAGVPPAPPLPASGDSGHGRTSRDPFRLFQSILDSMGDGIVVADEEGRFLLFNPAAEQILGIGLRDVSPQQWAETYGVYYPDGSTLYPPDQMPLARAIRGEDADQVELFIRNPARPEGVLVSVTGRPMRDAAGRPSGGVVVIRDITAQRRSEEQLAFKRSLLQALMENIPDTIYFKDTQSRFTCISRSLAARFGLADPLAAVGKTDFDFFSEEHARQAYDDEQELIRNGRPIIDKEEKETWPDGHVTWVSTTKMPLVDEQGRAIGTFGLSRDSTARKEAELALRASEERTRLIVDTAYDAFVAMDERGRIAAWNRQAELTFGWKPDEVLGRPLAETIVPARHRAAHTSGLAHFLATGEGPVLNQRLELAAVRRGGDEFPVELTITALRLGEQYLFAAFLRDITRRKLAEEELRRAKDAAEAASRAKSEFLANVSHEIRTPMNGIIGMTDLALRTELTPEQREYLALVKSSADALLTVINDVLDFSKIEAGKLDIDAASFGLRDLLGDALKSLALRAHAKGLELAWRADDGVPDWVVGDAARLRQILVNLVGNAVKFTERGEVVVGVRRTAEDKQTEGPGSVSLSFEVRDTGIGIPAEKQQAIFAPFVQADGSTTRRYGGTGLGLSISRRLVELMGGRLWMESEAGRGSTFHFTLPLAPSGEPRPEPAPQVDAAALRGLRVLIVDDNATNRRILLDLARSWGLEPVAVEGGAEAVAELARAQAAGTPFPLILLDAMMPGMDGFDLAAEIQRRPELAGATVMMLTSADRQGDAARCRALGLAAYLTKPFKPSELFDSILTALGNGFAPPPDRRAGAGTQRAEVPACRRPLRVLVAEDHPINQALLRSLLARQGHDVVMTSNGQEVVAAFREEGRPFDVVLMDVQMPEMDGFEATAAIRATEGGARRTPIVAMTAHAMTGDRERCLEAGMDAYLPKPLAAEELWEALAKIAEGEPPGAKPPPPAPAAEGPPPEGPQPTGVDREVALARVGGDARLLGLLVQMFRDEGPRLRDEIRKAVGAGDAALLRRGAHTLKSAAGNVGATGVADIALELETMGRSGELAGAPAALARLEDALARLGPGLDALCRPGGP